jgi:hypothetical protein
MTTIEETVPAKKISGMSKINNNDIIDDIEHEDNQRHLGGLLFTFIDQWDWIDRVDGSNDYFDSPIKSSMIRDNFNLWVKTHHPDLQNAKTIKNVILFAKELAMHPDIVCGHKSNYKTYYSKKQFERHKNPTKF